MKTKKTKAVKLGKKSKGISDVLPSTSLPPLVEGQVQYFLRVTVSKILWIIPRPPAAPLVRLRWWGETSCGTLFRPGDASHAERKSVKMTARYAVRCGSKQFTSYLTDMGILVLEVMEKPDHLPIGRVEINGIPQLSTTHGISGFFKMLSPTSEKLGEVQVSLALEPLSDICDSSSSSVPNTDMSMDGAVSVQSSAVLHSSKAGSFENLIELPPHKSSLTVASGKESLQSSTCNTPRGRDHVYFQENAKITKTVSSENKQSLSSASVAPAEAFEAGNKQTAARALLTDNQSTKNLISVLLDRGSKLRNAMVVSAMQTVPDSVSALVDIPYVGPYQDISKPILKTASPSEKLLDNLAVSEAISITKASLLPSPEHPLKEVHPNTDAAAIKLLLGSTDSIPLHYWDGLGSPPESLSAGNSVLDESELNDPHYDQRLLEHLFYKNSKSESSASDFTSEDEELDLSKEKLKQQCLCKADMHNISHNASDHDVTNLNRNGEGQSTSSYPVQEGPLPDEQEMQAIGLSVDRLTLLGRVYLARVIIQTLKLPPDCTQTTPKQKGSTGKPPRPVPGRKCTYFVQYHFPVATPSRGGGTDVSMASEITWVASSKITREVVKFQQRFVFPICFNGLMIERWWNSDLVFKIHSRMSTQKKPILIGTATLALRTVIQSDLLSIASELPVEVVSDNKGQRQQIGPLKVTVELVAHNKDLTSVNARLAISPKATYAISSVGPKLSGEQLKGVDVCPLDPHPFGPRALKSSSKKNVEAHLKQNLANNIFRPSYQDHRKPSPESAAQNSLEQFNFAVEEEKGFLLYVLLMAPDGKDFVVGDGRMQQQDNIYLKCKLFSTDEAIRSTVSGSTNCPIFNLSLVTPITLTPRLLERMKNNMMIIEVWNKIINTGQEKLLGLVKLPLHQFYISFRDPKISQLLLQAQYPVVAVDSYMPMMDVFTGSQKGNLRVLLAMGEADQIAALQKLKNDEGMSLADFQQMPHFLDQVLSVPSKLDRRETKRLIEHMFEINVVQLKGLTPLQSTVWGEADCYIQYYFPTQDVNAIPERVPFGNNIMLKPFRTATTLCVPDPLFNDCQNHSLLIPPDLPVQKILLSTCSKQMFGEGGGIQFEVWCRYYYPNVRDQLVARGVLPLSKLCAMVTMQHHKEVGVQIFSIPLLPRTENAEGHPLRSTGLLDVSIKYRCSVQTTEDAKEGIIASRAVSLSLKLLRASGLQAAARAAAERNHSLKYQAEIGVNTYITIHISFLLEIETRRTNVVARTFCPEFDHSSEFLCNLVIQKSTGERFSLAELLESSEAVFTIYHQSVTIAKQSTFDIGSSRDVELGSVRIPLAGLLTRRTGISGWYAVSLPELITSQSCGALQNLGGGLEISIHFAHPNDRERVIKAAEALDWRCGTSEEKVKEWQSPESSVSITLTVSRIWLPLHCVTLPGQEHLDKSTFCYLRYKLYDREHACTSLQKSVLTTNKRYVTVNFDEVKTVYLKRTQSLIWYLNEERLEVQVWVAYGNNKTLRPHDTDRLIGYSFIDLSTLAEKSSRKLTVSGIYPLFKRGASDLSGAAVRFHVTLVPNDPPLSDDGTYQRICFAENGHDYEHSTEEDEPIINEKEQTSEACIDKETSTGSNIECKKMANEISEMELANTFAVNVVVERAMHISLKGCPLTEQTGVKPSCYVSYATPVSPTPITTHVIENAYSPVWDHQQQTRLAKELLLDPQQTLVFKVWHKADIDRVIGFASVDLSSLLSGFLCICGWYNIIDFSGQCQGQLKVAITPLENIHHLRGKRWTQTHKLKAGSIPTLESLYKTSGTYNSFPSHISKYSEQLITSLKSDALSANDRSVNTDVQTSRHEEHMKNVRRFHQYLQQMENSMHSAGYSEPLSQTSRTSLFSALRRNLSELDDIQRYFNEKLSTSPCSRMINPTPQRRTNENQMNDCNRPSQPDGEILEKSRKLVAESLHFMNGLQDRNEADVAIPMQSSQDTEEDWEKIAENEPQQLENESNRTKNKVFPYLQSPERATHFCAQRSPELRKNEIDEYSDQDHRSSQNSPTVETETHQNDYGSEGWSEEGYEEDVIQPRTLNDVTVMTDRTSPWSSVFSDLQEDYKHECEGKKETQKPIRNGSLAAEVQVNPIHVHDELLIKRLQNESCKPPSNMEAGESSPYTEKSPTINEGTGFDLPDRNVILQSEQFICTELLEIQTSDDQDCVSSNPDKAEERVQENENLTEHDSFHCRAFSVTDRKERDLKVKNILEEHHHANSIGEVENENQVSFERQNHEDSQFSKAGGEGVPRMHEESANKDSTDDAHSVSLPDPVVIPNFFLPPSHLEASMRVLNVAQSFQTTAADPNKVSSLNRTSSRRSNRQKPRLMPSELPKEETERIAKIFAGHFTEES
ncbi:C2 domain-containing protein 3 isoform X2 [Stegostoma tigrinum]|uniref:C2 domain-containing protein 3 isoform X2 n=1 Tax=Stegostoma tigrinum TaxID=3053191 RepID=UPI0028709C52|nr:C2 domain-containing protein 3 isoform X2 [Stegostoma tigrinum]